MKLKIKSNFFICGLMGWCFECFFTGLKSVFKKDSKKLICTTSLWMFFIYGLAAFIKPIYNKIKNNSIIVRGLIYTITIFLVEFFTGSLLKKHNACPWDYSKCRFNIKGLVRLDYAPFWFIIGLIFEKILCNSNIAYQKAKSTQ